MKVKNKTKKTTLHKKIQDKTTYTRKDNSHKTRQPKYNLARASRIFVIGKKEDNNNITRQKKGEHIIIPYSLLQSP